MSPDRIEMTSEADLRSRLRELSDATASVAASPHVRERLLRTFDETADVHRRQARPVRWFPAAAVSFALLLATAALVMQTWPPATDAKRARAEASAIVDPSIGFQPVPGAWALPRLESARIVTYELPLTTLRAYGLEIFPEPNRPTIDAELLIGQDGYARAIRVKGSNRVGR